ncbi:MAG: hypothetical protein AAGD05_06615, partial [Bacteroidota bacterium]
MKKCLLLIGMCLCCSTSFAQQLFLEAFSGYNLTAYDLSQYNESQGYVPIGVRVAGGFERIQL